MRLGSIINGQVQTLGEEVFTSATNLQFEFITARLEDVTLACESAKTAFKLSNKNDFGSRITFLENLSAGLKQAKPKLLAAYCSESNLSEIRFEQELERVIKQIAYFQEWLVLRENSGNLLHMDVLDGVVIRKFDRPIGPIAVFGASNFPLAYSTVGGDVVSALAAGCPVVVKAHPFHVLTSHICAEVICLALQKAGIHSGFFSHLLAKDYSIGQMLVKNDCIKGVAFTGSLEGGRALMDLAATRRNPIPVFAEMGSLNPVIILSHEMNTLDCTKDLARSILTDNGQFCTKPGIILYVGRSSFTSFIDQLVGELNLLEEYHFLHTSIREKFDQACNSLAGSINLIQTKNGAVIIPLKMESYRDNEALRKELFGPAVVCVACDKESDAQEILDGLDGQLTGSIYCSVDRLNEYDQLLESMIDLCGRVILNGVPTGVRPVRSMHHGGPYPASSDSRFTAVGVDSVLRFLRPWSFQSSQKDMQNMNKRKNLEC